MKNLIFLLVPIVFLSCTSTMKMQLLNYDPPEDTSIPTQGNVLIINNVSTGASLELSDKKPANSVFHFFTNGKRTLPKDSYIVKANARHDSIQAQYCIQALVDELVNNSTFDSVSNINYSGKINSQTADSLCNLYRCSSLIILDKLQIESDYLFFRHMQDIKTVSETHIEYITEVRPYTRPNRGDIRTLNRTCKSLPAKPYNGPRSTTVTTYTTHTDLYSMTSIKNEVDCNWKVYIAKSNQFSEPIHTHLDITNNYPHIYAKNYCELPMHVSDSISLYTMLFNNYNTLSTDINMNISARLVYSLVPTIREVYVYGNKEFQEAEIHLLNNDWESARTCWEPNIENIDHEIAYCACYNMAIYYEVMGDLETAIEFASMGANKYNKQKAVDYLKELKNRLPK